MDRKLLTLSMVCGFFACWAAPHTTTRGEPTKSSPASGDALSPQQGIAATDDDVDGDGKERSKLRYFREGTVVEGKLGVFRSSGKRWIFVVDEETEKYTALENLGLERIARILSERPDTPTWRVNGSVTEYQGVNFLLIDRVVLVSRTPGEDSAPRQ